MLEQTLPLEPQPEAASPETTVPVGTIPPTVNSGASAPGGVGSETDSAALRFEAFQPGDGVPPFADTKPAVPPMENVAPPARVSGEEAQPNVTTRPAAPIPIAEPIAAAAAQSGVHPLLAMLVGGVLACGLIGFGMFLQGHRTGTVAVDPIAYVGGADHLSHPENDNAIVRAVRLVGPAVMNVDTTFGKSSDSPDFLPEPGGLGAQPLEGKGTGVVIDSKRGLMLTNAHVVAGATLIQVTNRDGQKFSGKIRGMDRLSDIAVVELNNKNLPEAKLAHMDNARDLAIGQWAIAIGNPYAQANSVTVGVVSAVGWLIDVPAGHSQQPFRLTDMIQTDAAINPGNSGGPLCNIQGEVIGINTAIIPFTTGLGFTIPINKAMSVAEQLIRNGKVQHPYIGVLMQVVSEDKKRQLGLPDTDGALVESTAPNSPASRAGLQPGDVIRALDGNIMKDRDEVQHYITDKKVGDVIKVDVLRNSSVKKSFNVTLGDRPATAEN